jgi:hypothetical protein
MPAAGGRLDQVRHRHEKGREALGGVEKAQIGGRVSRAEAVAAGRRKQAEDFAPGQEYEAGKEDERPWRRPERSQEPIADAAEAKGDRHRRFAANMVRDPAEERPGGAIRHIVDEERQGQGRDPGQHQRVGDVEVAGDQRHLRRRHQPARRNQDEHQIEHPEDRCRQHLRRRDALARLHDLGRRRRRGLAGERGAQRPGQHKDDGALDQPEPEERRAIAIGGDYRADRHDGQGRAGAETAGGEADREPAAIGEPFDRIADRGRVDGAGTDPRQRRPEIEVPEARGRRIDDPADRDHDPAKGDHQPRPVLGADPVDDPALQRRQPGLERHEQAEGELDVGDGPAVRLVHRMDEQGPAVLQIGDHHHRDDADDELQPAVRLRQSRCTRCQ